MYHFPVFSVHFSNVKYIHFVAWTFSSCRTETVSLLHKAPHFAVSLAPGNLWSLGHLLKAFVCLSSVAENSKAPWN